MREIERAFCCMPLGLNRVLGLGLVPGLALALAATGATGARAAAPIAERITERNASARLFGGSDADGGIGDWYLSNGVVEAIIDDVGLQDDLPPTAPSLPIQSEAAQSGGGILDLGLVGAHNDQLNQLFTVAGLSTSSFIVYDAIEAVATADSASIRVTGRALGFEPIASSDLPVVTEYIVEANQPWVTIRTTARNLGSEEPPLLGGFLDVLPWTTRALVPFTPLPERGFRHAGLSLSTPVTENPAYTAAAGNLSPVDGIVDPETGRTCGEVAYGLLGIETTFDADDEGPAEPRTRRVARFFGVSNVEATAFGNSPTSNLSPGSMLRYERRLYVGGRNDVASVTNLMLPVVAERQGFGTGTLRGDVDGADVAEIPASVLAIRIGGPEIRWLPLGSPITWARTDPAGRFEDVVVPEGTYDLEFRAPERDPVRVSNLVVGAGENVSVAVPALSPVGTLELQVRERPADGPVRRWNAFGSLADLFDALSFAFGTPPADPCSLGRWQGFRPPHGCAEPSWLGGLLRRRGRVPARVTLLGMGDTPDPRLALEFEALSFSPGLPDEDLRPETFGSALAQANFVLLPYGEGRVSLRPGRYEVLATRGPEYSLDRQVVEVTAGQSTRARLFVRRIVPTPGALGADFHIHSARSLDSSAAPEGRVAAFAAEGVEVMISSDHDFVLDYAPVIEHLGLGRFVTSVVGTEITTTAPNPPTFPDSVGHVNGWPLVVDPHARRDGSPEDEFVAPNVLFSRLRNAGAEVIQYNHVRAGVRGLGSIGFFNNFGCNRCANDVDRTCSVNNDCPASPEPRSCTCVGYQSDRPLTAPPNDLLLDDDITGSSGIPNPDGLRNIDFDVMEVANGLDVEGFLRLREDWFSLLNQVHDQTPQGRVPFIPATGVSDSHRHSLETAGYYRTYVLGRGDAPAWFDDERFHRSVRAGRMLASSGPYVEFEIRDPASAGPPAVLGSTLTPRSGHVELDIRVWATNWIPVDEVRVIANGRVLAELVFDADSDPPVRPAPEQPWDPSSQGVLRFRHEIPVELDVDTWFLVEAGVALDPIPVPDTFAARIVPGLTPLAFTNPIFVDLDGDGFDAPGVAGP